jgi:hypothetical protein
MVNSFAVSAPQASRRREGADVEVISCDADGGVRAVITSARPENFQAQQVGCSPSPAKGRLPQAGASRGR